MFYLSPLVDVTEVDVSTTIPAVATSIAVIVLRNTYKGPEMTQEFVPNTDDLVSKFGKPRKKVYNYSGNVSRVSNCYEDMASAAGYLKYGQMLYCTRVMPPSATFAGAFLDDSDT
jgi:hypothetical protein